MPVTSEASISQNHRPGKYRASTGWLNGTTEDLWEIPSPWIEPILELNELLNARAVDLKRVADRIREIRHLGHLVLQLCNYLAAEPQAGIGTIEEAAVLLGAERLRALILSAMLLRQSGTGAQHLSNTGRHCLTSAMVCDRIARWSGYEHPDLAFLAGFSHSFGRIGSKTSCFVGKPHMEEICPAKSFTSRSDKTSSEVLLCKGDREIGAAFRQIFEQYRDRAGVQIDKRLTSIVTAACRLAPVAIETREKRDGSAVVTATDCRCILQVCLPELEVAARAKLAEIIVNDRRELVPLLEFAYSELAQIDSGGAVLAPTEEAE